MAICLGKLMNRASVINPILFQCRLFTTPALIASNQIVSNIARRVAPVPESALLNVETQLLAQNIRSFSKTIANLNKQTSQSTPDGGANEEQLQIIFDSLREDLPQLFVKPLDYSKVHKDIVFENRIRGKTYHGILDYVKQISFLRLYGHFKYAYVKFDVIKMTMHKEDSTIKVRWRISGITGYKILFKMIQFRVWDPKKMIEQHQRVWIDGFSTFYVSDEGYIIRHIADKVMPNEDKELNPIEKVVDKLTGIPKLALFVSLSTNVAPVSFEIIII